MSVNRRQSTLHHSPLTKEQLRERENRDIEEKLSKLTSERREIVHNAGDLATTLKDFEYAFNAVALDDFPSPEQMDLMLDDFEDNKEKTIQTLNEVSRNLEKISLTNEVTDPEDFDSEYSTRSNRYSEEHNKKIASMISKLTTIFTKSKKYYNDVLQSFSEDMDADIKPDNEVNVEIAVIPMLQQKVVHLKKDLELAQMKSRSLNVQWAADKERYEDLLAQNKKELTALSQRLIVAETKKRYKEQVERDENMMTESVSRAEYNYALEEIEELKGKLSVMETELLEKRAGLDQALRDCAEKDVNLTNMERKIASLDQKLELSSQAKDHFQKKHEEAMAELEKKLGAARDAIEVLTNEKKNSATEADELRKEQEYLNRQVESLKRENDDNFKFLHKAEEDSKKMRTFAAEVQADNAALHAKINELTAEKEELNGKISGTLTERQSLVADVDSSRSQLRKLSNVVKSFCKNLKVANMEESLLGSLNTQADRMSSLELSVKECNARFASKVGKLENQIKIYRKKIMMLEYAQNGGSGGNGGGKPDEADESLGTVTENLPEILPELSEPPTPSEPVVALGSSDFVSREDFERAQLRERKALANLKAKEEELASNRKSMDIQRNAMESQTKSLEKQKAAMEEKLKEQLGMQESVSKLQEELKAAIGKLDDINNSNMTAVEKRLALAACVEDKFESAASRVIQDTLVEMGIVEDAPILLRPLSGTEIADSQSKSRPRTREGKAITRPRTQEDLVRVSSPKPEDRNPSVEVLVVNETPTAASSAASAALSRRTSRSDARGHSGGRNTGGVAPKSDVDTDDDHGEGSSSSRPSKHTSRAASRRASRERNNFSAKSRVSSAHLNGSNDSGKAEYSHKVCEEVSAELGAHAYNVWSAIKPLVLGDTQPSEEEIVKAIESVVQATVTDFAPALAGWRSKPISEPQTARLVEETGEESPEPPRPKSRSHPSSELEIQTLQDELFQPGSELENIAEPTDEEFSRLIAMGLSDFQLAKLTQLEYHCIFNSSVLEKEMEHSVDDTSIRAFRRGSKTMQVLESQIDVELQRIELTKQVIKHLGIAKLSEYYTSTESHIKKLDSFTAWRSVLAFKSGGVFLDVLTVHRDVINNCIQQAGSWQAAMEWVKNHDDPRSNTEIWPEFFRVRVLEHYRSVLNEKVEDSNFEISNLNSQLSELKSAMDTLRLNQSEARRHSRMNRGSFDSRAHYQASHRKRAGDDPANPGLNHFKEDPASTAKTLRTGGQVAGGGHRPRHDDSPGKNDATSSVSLSNVRQEVGNNNNRPGSRQHSRPGSSGVPAEDHVSAAVDHLNKEEGLPSANSRSSSAQKKDNQTVESRQHEIEVDHVDSNSVHRKRSSAEIQTGDSKAMLPKKSEGEMDEPAGTHSGRPPRSRGEVRDEAGSGDGASIADRRRYKEEKSESGDVQILHLDGDLDESMDDEVEVVKNSKKKSGGRPRSKSVKEVDAHEGGFEGDDEDFSHSRDEGSDRSRNRRASEQMLATVRNIRNLAHEGQHTRDEAKKMTVKLMARENLRRHLNEHRRNSRGGKDSDSDGPSRPKTAASTLSSVHDAEQHDIDDDLEVKEAHLKMYDDKLNVALRAANSCIDGMAVKKNIGAMSKLMDVGTTERPPRSLHKLADDLALRLLSNDEDAKVIVEVALEAIDCWKDGLVHQAAEMMALAIPYCTLPEETAFVLALKTRLVSVEDVTGEAYEVGEKLHSMALYVDKLHSMEELHRQQWLQSQHQQQQHVQDLIKHAHEHDDATQHTQLQHLSQAIPTAPAGPLLASGTAMTMSAHQATLHPHHSPLIPAHHAPPVRSPSQPPTPGKPAEPFSRSFSPAVGKQANNNSGPGSRRTTQFDRKESPSFADVGLAAALKKNRLARQEDRENTRRLASQLREEVAAVVATALAATTTERVDMGIQTDDLGFEGLGPSMEQQSPNSSRLDKPDNRGSNDDDDGFGFDDDDEEDDTAEELAGLSYSTKIALSKTEKDSQVPLSQLTNAFDTVAAALPPGFKLVHVTDGQLELCQGVTYASFNRLTEQQYGNLPRGVVYCYRDTDAALMNGLKRVPRYVTDVPRIDGCEALLVPTVFELTEEIRLITNISMQPFMELPRDVFVVHMIRNAVLPSGLTVVELSPQVELPPEVTIPAGLEIVQMHLAVMLPPGVQISPDIEIIPPPTDMPPLPHNVQLIKRQPGTQLPNFMTPIHAATVEHQTELVLHSKMEEGCTLLKKPKGIEFGLGVELVSRPPGHPMPVGCSPVPIWEYPKGLQLPAFAELVRLSPRFDLPPDCVPFQNWKIYPRPCGLRLPPNTYLVNYEGDRGGGIIPPCMKKVPMPDVPYGTLVPKSVIAIEFMSTFGLPVPYGTTLSPGIRVLHPEEAVVVSRGKNGKISKANDVENLLRLLPINAVLVSRDTGAPLPEEVERASKGNLPSGVLLAPHVEILLLSIRFELPAGVKIENGALLGRRTQICPGTILSRDLEVLEWPRKLHLTPGTELVRLTHGCDMPIGYHPTQFPRAELQAMGLERDCFVVRLPHFIKMESAQQLSEKVNVVTEFTPDSPTGGSPGKDSSAGSPVAFGRQFSVETGQSIPEGSVLVLRNSKRNRLPAEMTSLPKSHLPADVKNAIVRHNVVTKPVGNAANNPAATVTSSTQNYVHRPYLDAVQLSPCFAFPPGTELAPGVVVLPRPFWMQSTSSWIELVSIPSQPAPSEKEPTDELAKKKKKFAKRLSRRLKYMRVYLRPEINPLTNTPYELPPNTELLLIPDDIQVYKWGSLPGIEATIRPEGIHLPTGHFLIERPRTDDIPLGMRLGVASQYEKYFSSISLPPCIEVIHIIPTYHLPRGVGLQSSLPLVPPNNSDMSMHWASFSTTAILENVSGISTIQLSHLQPLSHGVCTVSNPIGWPGQPPSLSPELSSQFMTALPSRSSNNDEIKAYAFVALDVTDYCMLPGMEIVPNSDEYVSLFFKEYEGFAYEHRKRGEDFLSDDSSGAMSEIIHSARDDLPPSSPIVDSVQSFKITDIIKLVTLPRKLPNPRERHRKWARELNSRSDSRKQAKVDHITVHPRVMAFPEPDAIPTAISGLTTSTETEATEGLSIAVEEKDGENAVVSDPGSERGSIPPPSARNRPSIQQPYQLQLPVRKSTVASGSDSINQRSRLFLRLGGTSSADRFAPDVDTVLACLDAAQEEIDMLEVENNKYRFKTVAAQREIDHLKNKIERMMEQQKAKTEEYQALREKASELKGQVANVNKTLELRSYDFKEAKRRLLEEMLGYQTRIDVLSSQLSHWQDVAEGVDQMKASHSKELLKIRTVCRERIRNTLDRTVRGCRVFVDLLGEVLRDFARGLITETWQQKLIAVKSSKHFHELAAQFLQATTAGASPSTVGTAGDEGSAIVRSIGKPVADKTEQSHKNIGRFSEKGDDLQTGAGVMDDDDVSVLSNEPEPIPPSKASSKAKDKPRDSSQKEESLPPNKTVSSLSIDSKSSSPRRVVNFPALPKAISPTAQHYGSVYLSNGPAKEIGIDFAEESAKTLESVIQMFDSLATTRPSTGLAKIQFSGRPHGESDELSEISAGQSEASIVSSYLNAGDHRKSSVAPASVDIGAMAEEDEDFDTRQSLELMNAVKSLAEDARPYLMTWQKEVLNQIRMIGQDERAMYYQALTFADMEKQVFLRQQRIAAVKAEQQECIIGDARQAANGVPVLTTELREEIALLRLEISRLQGERFDSAIEALRTQVERIEKLTVMENSLLTQAETVAQQAEDKIQLANAENGEFITGAEIKAIKAEAAVLKKEAQQYRDRAAVVAKDRQEGVLGIVRDIESYEKTVQDVVPPQLLSQLLKWGAFRFEESRRKDAVSTEIAALSPSRMASRESATSSRPRSNEMAMGSSTDMLREIRAARPGVAVEQKNAQLLYTANMSHMPQTKLVMGSTGTMPPAPTKSHFNLNNVIPDDASSVGGGSFVSAFTRKSVLSVRSGVKQQSSAQQRQVQATGGRVRLKKLKDAPDVVFTGSSDAVSRGGLLAASSSTNALALPSINVGLSFTSLTRQAQQHAPNPSSA